jgi:hypothetical protein
MSNITACEETVRGYTVVEVEDKEEIMQGCQSLTTIFEQMVRTVDLYVMFERILFRQFGNNTNLGDLLIFCIHPEIRNAHFSTK